MIKVPEKSRDQAPENPCYIRSLAVNYVELDPPKVSKDCPTIFFFQYKRFSGGMCLTWRRLRESPIRRAVQIPACCLLPARKSRHSGLRDQRRLCSGSDQVYSGLLALVIHLMRSRQLLTSPKRTPLRLISGLKSVTAVYSQSHSPALSFLLEVHRAHDNLEFGIRSSLRD